MIKSKRRKLDSKKFLLGILLVTSCGSLKNSNKLPIEEDLKGSDNPGPDDPGGGPGNPQLGGNPLLHDLNQLEVPEGVSKIKFAQARDEIRKLSNSGNDNFQMLVSKLKEVKNENDLDELSNELQKLQAENVYRKIIKVYNNSNNVAEFIDILRDFINKKNQIALALFNKVIDFEDSKVQEIVSTEAPKILNIYILDIVQDFISKYKREDAPQNGPRFFIPQTTVEIDGDDYKLQLLINCNMKIKSDGFRKFIITVPQKKFLDQFKSKKKTILGTDVPQLIKLKNYNFLLTLDKNINGDQFDKIASGNILSFVKNKTKATIDKVLDGYTKSMKKCLSVLKKIGNKDIEFEIFKIIAVNYLNVTKEDITNKLANSGKKCKGLSITDRKNAVINFLRMFGLGNGGNDGGNKNPDVQIDIKTKEISINKLGIYKFEEDLVERNNRASTDKTMLMVTDNDSHKFVSWAKDDEGKTTNNLVESPILWTLDKTLNELKNFLQQKVWDDHFVLNYINNLSSDANETYLDIFCKYLDKMTQVMSNSFTATDGNSEHLFSEFDKSSKYIETKRECLLFCANSVNEKDSDKTIRNNVCDFTTKIIAFYDSLENTEIDHGNQLKCLIPNYCLANSGKVGGNNVASLHEINEIFGALNAVELAAIKSAKDKVFEEENEVLGKLILGMTLRCRIYIMVQHSSTVGSNIGYSTNPGVSWNDSCGKKIVTSIIRVVQQFFSGCLMKSSEGKKQDDTPVAGTIKWGNYKDGFHSLSMHTPCGNIGGIFNADQLSDVKGIQGFNFICDEDPDSGAPNPGINKFCGYGSFKITDLCRIVIPDGLVNKYVNVKYFKLRHKVSDNDSLGNIQFIEKGKCDTYPDMYRLLAWMGDKTVIGDNGIAILNWSPENGPNPGNLCKFDQINTIVCD